MKIYDTDFECHTHFYKDNLSQFYVLAVGDKFISNKSAVEKIKIENVDYFVKVFINNLNETDLICNE